MCKNDGDLNKQDLELATELRDFALNIQPPQKFAAHLENRLFHQRAHQYAHAATSVQILRKRRFTMFRRLAVVFATLVSAISLFSTFPSPQDPDDLPLLPRLAVASAHLSINTLSGGPGDVDLTWNTAVPSAPDVMPIYQVTAFPVVTTIEAAMEWADRFGLVNPEVYHDPQQPDMLTVRGSDARQVDFHSGMIYYSHDIVVTETAAMPYAQAVDVAVTFLKTYDLLPPAYQATPDEAPVPVPVEGQPPDPMQHVTLARALDGYPIVGQLTDFTVVVAPSGDVAFVSFKPFTYTQGAEYPIRSAEAAYAAILHGSRDLFQLSASMTSMPPGIPIPAQRHYMSPPMTPTVGENIDVTGFLYAQLSAEAGTPHFELVEQGMTYKLMAVPRASDLVALHQTPVRVVGSITRQLSNRLWELSVLDWHAVAPEDAPWVYGITECYLGTFVLHNGNAELVTQDGARYTIIAPPSDLTDGEYVSLCTDYPPDEENVITSWTMSVPPGALLEQIVQEDAGIEAQPAPTPLPPLFASTYDLSITRVELSYYYQDSPLYSETLLQPVWVFYGHNADRTHYFTAYVQAVESQYLEDMMP